MAEVWDNGPAAHGDLLVLLALADFADDGGHCWPSIARVAEKARMSERNCRRILRRLEDAGHLVTEAQRGRGNTCRYTIVVSRRTASEAPSEKPDTLAAFRKTGQTGHLKPDTTGHKTGHSCVRRTVIEPSLEPSEKNAREDVREILLSVLSPEAADDYIDHRKAKRAKLTARAASLIAKKLEHHPDPDAVVRESVANGWTGVFPENAKGRKTDDTFIAECRSIAEEYEREQAQRGMDRGQGENPPLPLLPARHAGNA